MAQDILVNTQSGDFIISESAPQTAYWNVVWGRLFDTDDMEYMNIVVPRGYMNKIKYENNQYECLASAEYYPVNNIFLVRLVVENIATGKYDLVKDYVHNAPDTTGAVFYPTYTGKAHEITACQLPLVNAEGKFRIVFKKYENSSYSRAVIMSASDADFAVGQSDSQSAQLLSRCAPGKYYRFPTTGLDLTKYINSVVEHTDMTEQLVKQFSSDSKQISEAEFDSSTGDLQIIFSGTDEAEDQNLTDPNLLDVELFRMADDDFIRAMYKQAVGITDNNEGFVGELLSTLTLAGLYDIDNASELDEVSPAISQGQIEADGSIKPANTNIATMELVSGKMYAINYPKNIVQYSSVDSVHPCWSHGTLFALYKDDKAVYVDEPFYTENNNEYIQYINSFDNRRCFIPLTNLTVKYCVGTDKEWIVRNGYGIRPLSDVVGNFNSILGIIANPLSGKIDGITTLHSTVDDIKINIKTNQVLIIQ